jgi:spore germination protein KB
MMVAGVFFKVGGWTYGASMAISQLFKLESNDSILIPLGAIITLLSLIIATNFVEHIERGFEPFMIYVHVPLEIIVTILLLCIAYMRKKFQA